jgi:hypothetical protein
MTADRKDIDRLARELAELPAIERARVVAEASRRAKALPRKARFQPPTLTGGTAWLGGSLTREELYGDDGR